MWPTAALYFSIGVNKTYQNKTIIFYVFVFLKRKKMSFKNKNSFLFFLLYEDYIWELISTTLRHLGIYRQMSISHIVTDVLLKYMSVFLWSYGWVYTLKNLWLGQKLSYDIKQMCFEVFTECIKHFHEN